MIWSACSDKGETLHIDVLKILAFISKTILSDQSFPIFRKKTNWSEVRQDVWFNIYA